MSRWHTPVTKRKSEGRSAADHKHRELPLTKPMCMKNVVKATPDACGPCRLSVAPFRLPFGDWCVSSLACLLRTEDWITGWRLSSSDPYTGFFMEEYVWSSITATVLINWLCLILLITFMTYWLFHVWSKVMCIEVHMTVPLWLWLYLSIMDPIWYGHLPQLAPFSLKVLSTVHFH